MHKQIGKNLLTTTTLNIFTYLVPLIVTPYFVRIVGTDNFGLLSFAQTIIQYLILFVGYNLDATVSGEVVIIKDNHEKLRKLFWKTMLARLILFFIATSIFLFLLLFYELANLNSSLLVVTFIGLIGYAITPLWLYQGTERFFELFLFVAIGKILFAVSIFLLVENFF